MLQYTIEGVNRRDHVRLGAVIRPGCWGKVYMLRRDAWQAAKEVAASP